MSEAVARKARKVRTGRVISAAMDKSVVVAVERITPHRLYGRRIKRTKKYMAHDENNQCQVGDLVRIMETRPMSRRKRWRVVTILEHSEAEALRTQDQLEEAAAEDEEVLEAAGVTASAPADEPADEEEGAGDEGDD